jgi:hypothetical protein
LAATSNAIKATLLLFCSQKHIHTHQHISSRCGMANVLLAILGLRQLGTTLAPHCCRMSKACSAQSCRKQRIPCNFYPKL